MDANEHKYYYFYLCLFVVIRGFTYPLSYFLFPISYFQLKGFGHFDIFSANSIKARATVVSAYFS
jgi:hypothetical protein